MFLKEVIDLMDTHAAHLYRKMIKASFDAITAINEFVDYEDAIADGLTGLAYILFEENIDFSFTNGVLVCNDYKIQEVHEAKGIHLVAEKDGSIIKDHPFGIYNVIKKAGRKHGI